VALVVDDNPRPRQVVSSQLARLGLEAVTLDSGQSVVALACHHRPLVIVLDVMLPLTDGLTAIVSLRRDPQTTRIPIVVATADPRSLVRLHASWIVLSESIVVLQKPFTAAELHAAVRQALGPPGHSSSRGEPGTA
jgi:two-component system, chemotaxis family, response regulator PixH